MLHFFINTGIKDTAYYWNELSKCLNIYCELKAICPDLDSLNIGGGFPIKNSLDFSYDYEYLTEEIIAQIKTSVPATESTNRTYSLNSDRLPSAKAARPSTRSSTRNNRTTARTGT